MIGIHQPPAGFPVIGYISLSKKLEYRGGLLEMRDYLVRIPEK
jgi:hypothetical protein